MTEYGLRRRDGDWWMGGNAWTRDIAKAKRFQNASAAVMEATTTPVIGIDWNWKPLPAREESVK